MSYVITLAEYFGTMPDRYPRDMNPVIINNAEVLLSRVNALLAALEDEFQFHGINSGWRPASYNAMVKKASQTSKHITAQAIDLTDSYEKLDTFLFDNQGYLENADLYAEWPSATIGWTHLQCVPPRSGNRYFRP